MRIAILEDGSSESELLSHGLKLAGHQTFICEHGADLLRALGHERFDALLVIFSMAHDRQVDVVRALRAGADDYSVKPVPRMELLARLEPVSRRRRKVQPKGGVFEVGAFRVDHQRRRITLDNQPLGLSAKDFDLAALLLSNVGRLLSREQLLQTIWGHRAVVSSRTLDTHISRVRSKLQLTPEYGWRLRAVYGYGYLLEPHTASASGSRYEAS